MLNAVVQQPPVTVAPRSALRVFGWLVLAALLFGGVGALLFMALGERNAASKVSDGPPGTAGVTVMQPGSEPITDGSGRSGSADRVAVEAVKPSIAAAIGSNTGGTDGSAKPAVRRPTASPADHKNPPVRTSPNRRPTKDTKVVAADDKDPKATAQLAREAASLEKAGKWLEARAAYQALEKKGYNPGEALYHQAWNAFQSNATSDAAQLAADAARQTGPFKMRAMLLYGDALFRQGEYARAKNIYLGVRKNQTGDDRGTTIKKIIACNKQLKLPEADGVED
jgi:hypothetical protein